MRPSIGVSSVFIISYIILVRQVLQDNDSSVRWPPARVLHCGKGWCVEVTRPQGSAWPEAKYCTVLTFGMVPPAPYHAARPGTVYEVLMG